MILAYIPFQYRDLSRHAYLTDNIPCALGNLSSENLVSIFRHPHKVILDVVDRVHTSSIF